MRHKQGFLTPDTGREMEQFCAENGDVLGVADDVLSDSHEVFFSLKVHGKDPKELLVSALFVHVLEYFQSTVLLMPRGMRSAARVSLRGLFESVVTLRAIAKDEDTMKAYVEEDQAQRLRLVKKALNTTSPVLEDLRKEAQSGLREKLEAEVTDGAIRILTTESLAKTAGLHEWYLTLYALLSSTAHVKVKDVEKLLVLSPDGEGVSSLRYGPRYEEARMTILTASQCMVFGLAGLGEAFDRDLQELCDRNVNAIGALVKVEVERTEKQSLDGP